MKPIQTTVLWTLLTMGMSVGAIAAEMPPLAAAAKLALTNNPAAPAEVTAVSAGAEVTLVGIPVNNNHFRDKEKYLVFLAFEGTPEVKDEFDKIMAECYPDKGLDGDAARKLQDQILARLKYVVDGPQLDELRKRPSIQALTGVVSEKDGKKTITVSKFKDVSYEGKNAHFSYPAKMLAPDKPFVMPDKEPLLLKINDTLSLKCIYVPPGRFFMGEPYYEAPHWAEDPPHMVTLTKGYYMAECPISQEMFEAVTGYNPSKVKDPQAFVNSSCVDMYKFCELLSKKTGRTVRIPTAAEWDYAARVGTSNPPFAIKYKEQDSGTQSTRENNYKPVPIKSAKPNAWGFYDIFSRGWERVSDSTAILDHEDAVDPQHIPAQDKVEATRGKKHGHMGKGSDGYAIGEIEFITSEPFDTTPFRFRVVVEADK